MLKIFLAVAVAVFASSMPTATNAQSTSGITTTKFRASNGKKVSITTNDFTGDTSIEASGSLSSSSWTTKTSCKSRKCETPYVVISVYMDYSATYDKATIRGGVDVPASFGRSILSDCRNGCRYFQIIILPITEELLSKASGEALQVMLTGGAEDKLIEVDLKGYHAVTEAVKTIQGE